MINESEILIVMHYKNYIFHIKIQLFKLLQSNLLASVLFNAMKNASVHLNSKSIYVYESYFRGIIILREKDMSS